jgi:succinoglycan biosynthesis transport protein ExoP
LPGGSTAADRYWRSVLTESVDALRTILTRSEAGESNRVLMITSARDREGKTLLATFLANSLTRAGRRTLLVDADLRRPSIHELLALPGEPGLSEVIRGEAAVEDMIQIEEVTGLSVLPAGQCDSQVIQALARFDFAGLFEKLRQHFDFIIIDSCPVLPVADSLEIAQHVDSVLVSIRFPVSRVPQVHAACERLRAVKARILGTVVQGTEGEFFGYKYKYFSQSRALP